MAPLIEDALDTGSSSSVAYRPSATNGAAVNGSTNGINGTHGTNGVTGTNGHHANNYAAVPSASSVNGHKPKKHNEHSPYLKPTEADDEHDIICVGFGPASLAVAAAMHDALAAGRKLRADGIPPKVLFLEKQATFAWHAGMLLQGAKMQISFVKDLATLRDPRSEFTFLNYLHRQGRLVDFTNLSTFLPARSEYEDYLRWAASFFDDVVRYNNEVIAVTPDAAVKSGSSVKGFSVLARNIQSGQTQTFRGRHVVIATGGQPSLPKSFPQKHPRVLHSSQYASSLPKLLPNQSAPYRVAVLGGGQSAAEIFKNVQTLYPNSQTRLIMRQEFLRPSDDSPFVNCVFNPEYIDDFSNRSAVHRSQLLTDARATNYGVVRLELIEELYETMYDQRREIGTDEKQWPHRILAGRQIKSIEPRDDDSLELRVQSLEDVLAEGFQDEEEIFQADLVIAATGYQRTAHVDILRGAWDLLPKAAPTKGAELRKGIAGWNVETEQGERKLAVGRDYKVRFAPGSVADDSGVWLQGCCEGTHGLSDTLLSVLGTRSGELVDAIFGKQQ